MQSGIHINGYKGNTIDIPKKAVLKGPDIATSDTFKDIHFDNPYFNKMVISTNGDLTFTHAVFI